MRISKSSDVHESNFTMQTGFTKKCKQI